MGPLVQWMEKQNQAERLWHKSAYVLDMQFIICMTSLVLQQVPFLPTQAAMRYLVYPKPRSIMSFVSRQLYHGNAIYIGLPKLSKYHPIHPKSSSLVDFTHWIQCWTFSIGYLLRAGSTLRGYPLSYYRIHKIPAPLYSIFSTWYAAHVDVVSSFQKEDLSLQMLCCWVISEIDLRTWTFPRPMEQSRQNVVGKGQVNSLAT